MSKPKGKIPSLISGSSGKPQVAIALKKCYCSRCKCDILNGGQCFDVPKLGGGFTSKRRVCMDCFKEILFQTEKDMDKLKSYTVTDKR